MLKHFRSLMLTCMALIASTTAFAGDWTVPVPKGTAFVTGENLYLWNVGECGFAYLGEAWGSQAVLSKTAGLTFKWTESSAGSGVYNAYDNHTLSGKKGQYVIRVNTDSKAGSGARTLFVDGALGRSHFKINDLGNGKYTIQMAPNDGDGDELTEENKETLNESGAGYSADWYVGIQKDYAKSLFYQNEGVTYGIWYDLAYDGNPNCEWLFVTEADYAICAAKGELIEKMNEAEGEGVDVSAAEAVLNNPDATLEQVQQAIQDIVNAIANQVTPDNPKDMTYLIKEPTCDSHTYWVSTAIAEDDGEKIQNNAIATNRCTDPVANAEGAFDGKFWENWDPSAWKGKMHQVVRGVPKGVYKASLAAFVNTLEEGNTISKKQYVFFNDVKCPLNTGLNRKYSATVIITEGCDTLDIGLAQDDYIANWAGIDNAALEFYGNGIEAYQYPSQDMWDNIDAEIEAIVDGRGLVENYTASYYEAFEAAVNAATSTTTVEDAIAAIDVTKAAHDALIQNVTLWCQLMDLRDEVEDAIFDEYLPLDDLQAELEDYLSEVALTNEELIEKIEYTKNALRDARLNGYAEGDNVTDIFITNAKFNVDGNASAKGWTATGSGATNVGGGNSGVAEVWNNTFDFSQDLTGLRNGAYELSIQAYFRAGDSGDAYAKFAAGDASVESFVYAGDNEAPFVNIMSWGLAEGGSGAWTGPHDDDLMRPNDVTSGNWAFAHTDAPYTVKVIGVVTDGKLRIGMKNISETNYHQWSLWNGFKMTYLAYNADKIRPALELLIESVSIANAPMYSADKEALVAAIAAAEAAVNGSDGQAMLDAYKNLSVAVKQATPSVNAYKNLVAAQTRLEDAIEQYAATADANILEEAKALLAAIKDAVANGSWTIEQVNAKISEVAVITGKLKIVGGEASDEKPIDFTSVIVNPNFANEDGGDSKEGWTAEMYDAKKGWTTSTDWHIGVEHNIIEGFECTFQIYQDLNYLPEGTYEVQCKGFFRDESMAAANAAFYNDTTEIRGMLYAESSAMVRQEKPLCNIIVIDDGCTSASGTEWGSIKYAAEEGADSITYFYPNMRVAARERFESGYYNNSLVVKVGEDGKLRIGFCNMQHKKNDWAATSNYRLIYYGKNSSKETNNDQTAIEGVEAKSELVAKAIFTIDGRQVNTLQKGVNIIRYTDANGKSIIKKVMVK